MATQSERREKTRGAIVKAARRIFGERGFAATTMDDIAGSARVAKGAVYHHFTTKEELFGAVFDQVSRDLVVEIDRIARAEKDVLAAMAAGTEAYFAACAKGATGQIILRDGPAVLGWECWREIDAKHFGGKLPRAIEIAIEERIDRAATGRTAGATIARRDDGSSSRLLDRKQTSRAPKMPAPSAGCWMHCG